MRRGFAIAAALACATCNAAAGSQPYRVERDLAYAEHERNRGDLYLPEDRGPRAGVLVIHGGSWARGNRGRMKRWSERLAAEGYAAFNIDYRLAPEHAHPAQIEDVRAAFAWLQERGQTLGLDPERLAATGYSAGGHLALLLALEESAATRPAAVAAGAAPTDLLAYPDNPVLRAFLGAGQQQRALYRSASPLHHVSPDDPPVLLFHGVIDSVVSVEHSRRLHASLVESGVASELFEQPLTGHMTTYVFDREAFEKSLAFFEAQLN